MQRTVRGVVTDTVGSPLRYANIGVGGMHTISNDAGQFAFEVGSTTALKLEVRRLGYQPVVLRLPAGGDTSVTITMSPYAQNLSAIRVTADRIRTLEARGFYERLAHRAKWGGSAQFVTPEEVERRRTGRTSQLLEGLNGISLQRGPLCRFSSFTCYVAVGYGNCVMAVYIDGVRLESSGPPDPTVPDHRRPVYIDEYTPIAHVSAIEVYQRPTSAPPRFQSDVGKCGVVLIWTK
jgi:hypothetical protein